jgi:hypothetical protein
MPHLFKFQLYERLVINLNQNRQSCGACLRSIVVICVKVECSDNRIRRNVDKSRLTLIVASRFSSKTCSWRGDF